MSKDYYEGSDESEEIFSAKGGLRRWITKPECIIIIAAILLIICFRGKWGQAADTCEYCVHYDMATFYGISIIFFIIFVSLIYIGLKHKTAKIIWNGGHSTTSGRLRPAGNFYIFSLGDVRAGEWEHQGGDGTLIAPMTAVIKKGDNVDISVRPEIVDETELPHIVYRRIKQEGMKAPYLFGFADEEQLFEVVDDPEKISGDKKPSVGYLISELKECYRAIHMLMDMSHLKMDAIEKHLASSSRMISKTQRESILSRINKAATEED